MTLRQIDARRITALLKPYKGRRPDRKRPVEVYRNLRRGGYSIRQDGRIVAHADAIMLADVTFHVSAAGWRRSLRLKAKTVHAWARGLLIGSGFGTVAEEASKLQRITYERRIGMFVHHLTVRPARQRQVKGAWGVALNQRGMFGAYFH